MKKKNKIIIAIITLLILIGSTFLFINLFGDKKDKTDKSENKTPKEKIEYYRTVHKKMYDYYKIKYKNINVPIDKKDAVIRINLGTLKRDGFPMDEFVSYDGKNECDLAMSYALRKVVDNEYIIEVYYKCGNDANYDYTKKQNVENSTKKTTTKRNSVSKEDFEANKPNKTTKKVGTTNE